MSFNDDGLVCNKIWDHLWFHPCYYCSVQPKTLNILQTTHCLNFPYPESHWIRCLIVLVKAPTKAPDLIREASDLGTGSKPAPINSIVSSAFSTSSARELGGWPNILTCLKSLEGGVTPIASKGMQST